MFNSLRRAKRKHFKERIKIVQENIWDREFNKEKLKMLREEIRVQFDRSREAAEGAKTNIVALCEKHKLEVDAVIAPAFKITDFPEADRSQFENLKGTFSRNSQDSLHMGEQMKALDEQISGSHEESCNQKIQASYAMLQMLKEHYKQL